MYEKIRLKNFLYIFLNVDNSGYPHDHPSHHSHHSTRSVQFNSSAICAFDKCTGMPICDEEGKKQAAANWDEPCEVDPNAEQSNGPPEIDWGNN